jgi:deoxyribose-phosphate aldolase
MSPVGGPRVNPVFDREWIDSTIAVGASRTGSAPALVRETAGLLSCLDATVLTPTAGASEIRDVARRAVRARAAAVCVYPVFAPVVSAEIDGSAVLLDLVAGGFPDGLATLDARVFEVERASELGAEEIDVPMRRDLARQQRWEELFTELAALREAAGTLTLKVILSTPDIPDARDVVRAARVAIMAGADFLKTATGREARRPTLESGAAMCVAIAEAYVRTGRRIGFKAAGGIDGVELASEWAQLVADHLGVDWLTPVHFRVGSSRLLVDPVVDTFLEGDGSL